MQGLEIDDLVQRLKPDEWRRSNPFSAEVIACHDVTFSPTASREEIAEALKTWLKTVPNQPCLFGRIAAPKGQILFSILNEADIAKGDEHIQVVIQSDRRAWKSKALRGEKHAFIVVIVSETVAFAEPSPALKAVAERLCDLYLFDQSGVTKRHDALILNKIGGRSLRWSVGVNVFASQGDGRWWHDHRIPGGLAFSMNSVGHMSQVLADAKCSGPGDRIPDAAALDNLRFWALPTAMRTIDIASKRSLNGTSLMGRREAMTCAAIPEDLRREVFTDIREEERTKALGNLAGFSEHAYQGWYDTDESIPDLYFHPAVDRPKGLEMMPLYFTYLHCYRDEDYRGMGIGEELISPEEAM